MRYFHYKLVDGGWTEWSDWGACSNSCGPGDYIRDRTCSNPLPQYNGTGCTGDVSEMASCVGPCTCKHNLVFTSNITREKARFYIFTFEVQLLIFLRVKYNIFKYTLYLIYIFLFF